MRLRAKVTLYLDQTAYETSQMTQADLEEDFAYMIDEWLKTIHTPYRFVTHMGRRRRVEDFTLDHYEVGFEPAREEEE